MSTSTNPASVSDWELIDVSAADHVFSERKPRGISFGTAGALSMVPAADTGSTTVVIPSGALAAGIIHPISPKEIKSSGTTAASIVAWY